MGSTRVYSNTASIHAQISAPKINTDEQPDLAKALKITSLPTVYGIYQGKAVDQFMGMQPPKKKQPKVSANSRRQCTLHLQRVAMAYMPEFSKLCKELDLVNKETEEAQFNIMTLDDVKARKLIEFVKRKMRAIIQKEKDQQQCDKQG